jgi:hypothetical protein
MFSALRQVVANAVSDLTRAGGTNSHIHFDTPEFEGVVPAFEDTAWVDLAREIIAEAGRHSNHILVDVPVGSWHVPPSREELTSLKSLAPWEPPGIYLLPDGESAFDHRLKRGWHLDYAPSVDGATGWWAGHLDHDTPGAPIWRVSLRYETTRQ